MQKDSICVHSDGADFSIDIANDVLHTGEILTSDEISLQETSIAELTAAASTEVTYEGSLAKDSVVLLEQIRTIDKRRLKERMGELDNTLMHRVDDALSISFGLNNII